MKTQIYIEFFEVMRGGRVQEESKHFQKDDNFIYVKVPKFPGKKRRN